MTVRDLMRHTSGLTYGPFPDSPVDELYRKNQVKAATSTGRCDEHAPSPEGHSEEVVVSEGGCAESRARPFKASACGTGKDNRVSNPRNNVTASPARACSLDGRAGHGVQTARGQTRS